MAEANGPLQRITSNVATAIILAILGLGAVVVESRVQISTIKTRDHAIENTLISDADQHEHFDQRLNELERFDAATAANRFTIYDAQALERAIRDDIPPEQVVQALRVLDEQVRDLQERIRQLETATTQLQARP